MIRLQAEDQENVEFCRKVQFAAEVVTSKDTPGTAAVLNANESVLSSIAPGWLL
jgi:hypothetical protein